MKKSYLSLASLPFFIGSLFAGSDTTNHSTPATEPQRFFISADFIYWNIKQDGLEYAFLGIATSDVPLTKGKVYKPHFEWDPGFKVGAGFNLAHDGWDLCANYTWINSDASTSTGPAAPYPLDMPIFLGLNGLSAGSTLFSSREKWEFQFSTVDLELGKVIALPMHFLVRPYFGLKGTWHDNDLHASFNTSSIGTFTDRRSNDFWGVGLRGGLYSKWSFLQHWGVYGNFAVSTLWTQNKASRKAFITVPGVPILDMHETIHSVMPVLEMSLGIAYDTGISNDRYHFSLALGWELQDWINYNELIGLLQVGSNGDLVMQGLTAHARFDF